MMTQADLELLEQYIDGTLADGDAQRLRTLLRDSAEARATLRSLATIDFGLQDMASTANAPDLTDGESRGSWGEPKALIAKRTPATSFTRALLAMAGMIIVALTASLYLQRSNTERNFQQPREEQPIAKITGLNGPLGWTGDGGLVSYDLSVGAELPGGTIEGIAPSSWFVLEFSDGSTVTIFGNSVLTFSDHGQKKLHLKEGNLSCSVKPQPAGKPMLIYTRSAMLEVLGTQFEVEAELAATTLNVSEGTVRIKRFSDGSTVDVSAGHRVIAAADHEMRPLPVPDSVSEWKSQLHAGPDGGRGKWSPATDIQDAKLEAIPYTAPEGITIYTATLDVSRGDKPPVILQPASRLRVRGRIASPHKVYFGVTVRHANGEFAGRFQVIRPAVEFQSGEDFEVILPLQDFQLDSSLDKMKNKLPSVPFDLVVESFWCHTLDEQAGLGIVEVELIPPTADTSK